MLMSMGEYWKLSRLGEENAWFWNPSTDSGHHGTTLHICEGLILWLFLSNSSCQHNLQGAHFLGSISVVLDLELCWVWFDACSPQTRFTNALPILLYVAATGVHNILYITMRGLSDSGCSHDLSK
jgi:hypothetical protein